MHKQGQSGDFLSIGYFMFLLFIIGATIFLMAKIVLGVAYDARLSDASLMGYKIEKCLSERDLIESDITNIQSTCGIILSNQNNNKKKFVLQISTNEKNLFSYGDTTSCGLYKLNKNNARCVNKLIRTNIDGKETDLQVITGSNLEVEKQ